MKISDLEYRGRDGEHYVGYLAMPDHPDGPAVLLAHNAPGVSDFERTIARRLAGLGYVVLCADYIGDGEVLAMNAIGPRLGSAIADTTLLRDAITAGLSALIAQPGVDAGRVAMAGAATLLALTLPDWANLPGALFALYLVGTGSFFLGQQKVVPPWMQGSPMLFALALAPLVIMLIWLVRTAMMRSSPLAPSPA